jgi:hypothetical protein
MPDRYPGYDVLAKRHTPSWDEQTRQVIDRRLAMPRDPRFFTADEWQTMNALCDRIVPQPKHRPPVPVAAMVDDKLARNLTDGYRDSRLPALQEAWRRGLRAVDAEAHARLGARFHAAGTAEQNDLLTRMQRGELDNPAWGGMPCALWFSQRLLHDITAAYYAHPTAWNEIGFGGPASPRGYVRMGFDRHDPWEAVAASPHDGNGTRQARARRHAR